MKDLHALYKRETGNVVNSPEIQGELSHKLNVVSFDLEDFQNTSYDFLGWDSECLTLPDKNYISWLESKITELLKIN